MPAKGCKHAHRWLQPHPRCRHGAAAGCGSSAATGSGANAQPTGVRLALDWYPNPDHVGIYTAIDHGFFAAPAWT